jgi:hypothetical protein
VKGVGSFSSDVTWAVNGVAGGNGTVGTISSSGLYTAPAVVPAQPSVSIVATSITTPSVSGAAQETISSGITSISVTPTNLNMPAGQSQQFIAKVGGVANQSVVWSISGPPGVPTGTVSPSGLYTPPGNLSAPTGFNIQAASALDAHAAGSGFVQVFPLPVLTGISSNPADAGDTVNFNGTNLFSVITAQFTGPNNAPLQSVALGGQAVVPHSATSGPVKLTEQFPGFAPVVTNSVAFTRTPRLRIRAGNRDLASGESTQMQFRILGNPAPQAITWSAGLGSISSSGLYQAPAAVLSDSFVHVTGCIQGTTICDSQILGLHPFRIEPFQPVVSLGGSVQLAAISGGSPVAATWAQLTGPGSLASNGTYTAGLTLPDAGSAGVASTFSGSAENAFVAVTGGFPGLVQRVNDYIDFNLPIPFGTEDEGIVISGNRAYVLGAGSVDPLFFSKTYFWIDVYDVTDPVHPAWLDVVEAACRGPLFTSGTFLHQLCSFDTTQSTFPTTIATFDITGQQPVLVAQQVVLSQFFSGFNNGVAVSVPSSGLNPLPPGTISIYDLSGGSITEHDFIPQVNGSPVTSVSAATVVPGRVLAIFTTDPTATSSQLGAFDLSTNPPAFLGSVPATSSGVMIVSGNTLFVGGDAYDISGAAPVHMGGIPGFQAGAVNGNLVYATTGQSYARVIDFTTPAQPKLLSVVGQVGVSGGSPAQWVGDRLLLAEGNGGLGVYEAGLPGGLVEQGELPGGGFAVIGLDQLATPSNLFVAALNTIGGVMNIYDTSSVPATPLGRLQLGTQTPVALALSGATLYVGTDTSLLALDVTSLSAPNQLNSLPVVDVTSLAISGSTLYLGTLDSHLIIFDISQPASPVQKASILLPGVADRMTVTGNLLIIADDLSGLLLLNITNPLSPLLLGQAAVPAGDLALDGNLVLVAAADQGLAIVDITNPSSPVVVSTTPLNMPQIFGGRPAPVLAVTVEARSSIAYLGAFQNNATLFGFDYRQPAHPRLVSLASFGTGTDESLISLRAGGNSLFVGGDMAVFFQTDLSQPGNVINSALLPSVLVPPPAAPPVHSLLGRSMATFKLRRAAKPPLAH